MRESGSSENRQRAPRARAPSDRPKAYQSTSAPTVASIATRMPTTSAMGRAPDSAPAPTSIGTAGIGSPACTAKAQAKSTTTPYWMRMSGIVMFDLDDRRIAQDAVGGLTVYEMLR